MIQLVELHLIKSIKEQLLKSGFVIIPNWGAFFLEPVSAYFDERSHRFIPPHYKILFNSKIKHLDGALAISIVQQTNLPYFNVLQNLKDITNYWHKAINQYNRLEIKTFGTFEKHNTHISFTPNKLAFEFPDFYGLKEIQLENYDIEHTIIFSLPESQQKSIRKLIKAAIIIPIAIAFSILPSKINYYSFDSHASFIRKVNKNEQSVILSSQSIEKTIDSLTNIKIALKPDLKTNFSQSVEKSDTSTLNVKTSENKLINEKQTNTKFYYIIIGSLTTMKQVNEFRSMLKKHNITDTEVLDCNGKLRIAYEKFENREEANKALEIFKNKNPELSGWILHW